MHIYFYLVTTLFFIVLEWLYDQQATEIVFVT